MRDPKSKIVSREEMRQAVLDSVPPGTEKLNLEAFDAGCAHYDEAYGDGKKKAATEMAGAAGG